MKRLSYIFSSGAFLLIALSFFGFSHAARCQDAEPPTVLSAEFGNLSNTIVIVTFSEPIHPDQVFALDNYILTGPLGEVVEIFAVSQQNDEGTLFYLHLNVTASSGSQLTLFDISDLALNVINPNPTILPVLGGSPTVLSAVFENANNEIIVRFSEPMDLGGVLEPANYQVISPSGELRYVVSVAQKDSAGAQYRLTLDAPADSGSSLSVYWVWDLEFYYIYPIPTTLVVRDPADTTPPTVSASVATFHLTPPNYKLSDVGLTIMASDNVTANPTISIQVLSDEALSAGDFNYTNGVLTLRAARDNAGDGRVYLIIATATDGAGNFSQTCTTVVVPYSNSPSAIESVEAQAAAAAANCAF